MSALDALRERVKGTLSPDRYAHTLGVEREITRMATLYCPDKEEMLRAAALLHDVTKEYTAEQTAEVLTREGIVLRPDEAATPAIHHAITAPYEIKRDYTPFATNELLSAVRWHTTGHADMTLCEALLYLADVIEEGRAYPACVALREQFWGAEPDKMEELARRVHLVHVLLTSLVGVRDSILARGGAVCADTEAAIASLNLTKTLL